MVRVFPSAMGGAMCGATGGATSGICVNGLAKVSCSSERAHSLSPGHKGTVNESLGVDRNDTPFTFAFICEIQHLICSNLFAEITL